MATVMEVQGLAKRYGKPPLAVTQALSGMEFKIDQGEFVAVMGPSGSGKTTLLNIMAGLDVPNEGAVLINGSALSQLTGEELARFRRTQLGFVFQDYNLLDTLTLGENISLPLLLSGSPNPARVKAVMALLGIENLGERFPFQVSGGQQQRAAVARAIVHRPAVVLADEPSGNLDSKAAAALLAQFGELNVSHGVTIVMVTHDARAASHARRVLVVSDGRLHTELLREDALQTHFYDMIVSALG